MFLTLFGLALLVALLQGSLYLLITRLQAYREWRDAAPQRESEVFVMALCGLVSSGLLAASGQGGAPPPIGGIDDLASSPASIGNRQSLPPVPSYLLAALPQGAWPASMGAVPIDVGRVPAVAQRRPSP